MPEGRFVQPHANSNEAIGCTAPENDLGAERMLDCFDEVAGSADIKWRTDELMTLLRGEDQAVSPPSA
jgi:hypothetical protein